MRKAVHVDDRNYDKEARELIRNLSDDDKYGLYKIVLDKQKQYQNEERDRELTAVRKILEGDSHLDVYRLRSIEKGYRSSMAHDLNLGDLKANQKSSKKKQ